ncbi:hypothetical protein SAMN05421679_101364 [Epilithonimonas pallida]|uniref:Uncharacterized protein n=1 Tax=Epilithonimonas pallida TaxID=373671 RepID=A0ABY1QZG3_9FLAO|nr:hypothetical protein SAMN05421679_101364 [Epilithonimonas pallida]HAO07201.1 hypothetical protein [Chryseobacterium sp.]
MINDESLASLFKSSTKVFGKSTAEVNHRYTFLVEAVCNFYEYYLLVKFFLKTFQRLEYQ